MTAEKHELADRELDQGAGGWTCSSDRFIYDNKGRKIATRYGENELVYVPCYKCRKPTHEGSCGWYCDPCDVHIWFPTTANWPGTVEELKAAANS